MLSEIRRLKTVISNLVRDLLDADPEWSGQHNLILKDILQRTEMLQNVRYSNERFGIHYVWTEQCSVQTSKSTD